MKSTGTGSYRGPCQQADIRFRVLFGLAAFFSFVSGSVLFRWLNDEFEVRDFRHVMRAGSTLATRSDPIIKPTNVVFFMDGFEAEVNRMNQGGAGGEIRLFRSFINAARSCSDVQMQVMTAVDDSSEASLRAADLIVSDQYRLASLISVIPDATNPAIACKLRFIDFWGTPPEQNHIHLRLEQFLVSYPNPWNEFLGFRQDLITSTNDDDSDRPIILLHGKLGRYFRNHLSVIAALTESYKVVATVPSAQLDGLQFPTSVVNVGICNSTEWQRILVRSSAVIGFGDPVLAPTAFEAIAAGSPYIFAKYAQPRSLTDLPAHPIRSQHDFMMKIGPPYAYAINVDEANAVLETVRSAIQNKIEAWIPEAYTAMQHSERVRNILHKDFCREEPSNLPQQII